MKQIIILLLLLIVLLLFTQEPLIGGCAGVALGYIQECCNNWAKENEVIRPFCVGRWIIENNQCKWECKTDEVILNAMD